MAERIQMQFGMLTWVGQGTCITWECRCHHGKGHFWGVSQLKSIVKHRILGKRVSCAKAGWILICDMFFRQLVAFLGHNDCTCVKIFVGVNFLIAINS